MNKFKKYCPNVYVAECDNEYQKGDIITLETKYGKEVECEVFNLVLKTADKFFYSIVRIEEKSYAERKAEKYNNSAIRNKEKSDQKWEESNEGRDFLSLGEPVKIGHHSEKRHRALIERNWKRIGKAIEFDETSKKAAEKAKYWEARAEQITLAHPDSLDYFAYELDKAAEYHKKLKNGELKNEHTYTMAYSSKKIRDLKKKIEIANKLWG